MPGACIEADRSLRIEDASFDAPTSTDPLVTLISASIAYSDPGAPATRRIWSAHMQTLCKFDNWNGVHQGHGRRKVTGSLDLDSGQERSFHDAIAVNLEACPTFYSAGL